MEIMQKLNQYKNKKVLVVGLGLQGGGVGVAAFFAELGAQVTVTDKKTQKELQDSLAKLKKNDIQYTLGKHDLNDFLNADMIFKGPSVPWTMPEIIEAQKKGIKVEMEVAFFASLCPAPIIGITGTRGKSTTTQMVYSMLKNAGKSVHLAGNIPQSSTIGLLHSVIETDIVVLELSSWALSGFHRKKVSPHISVFTNLYPDHLNYYQNMDEYFYDKAAIYLYQTDKDYLIANETLQTQIEKTNVRSKIEYFSSDDFVDELQNLQGEHNHANAAAAYKVAKALSLNLDQARKSLANFNGLPYRQQVVGRKGNVIFINDTTSTTPIATITALDTFKDKPIVLILGGNAKGLPTDELIEKLDTATYIVLLAGSFTDQIKTIILQKYQDRCSVIYDQLEAAVEEAFQIAKKLDTQTYILFSPGATSFAMFNNEFHRGDEYNRIVEELIKQ